MKINVIKRDGSIEPLNLEKFHRVVRWACEGLSGVSESEVEIKSQIQFYDKLGVQIKLFRLPYGAGVSVSKIRAKIAEHKMVHVFWSVDTLDWQDKNPQSVYNRALKQMAGQKSGVVLFHDIHPQSVIASTMLMDYFNEHKEKLTVCSVQGIVDQINKDLPSCK